MEKEQKQERLPEYESPTLKVVEVELEMEFVKGSKDVPVSGPDGMWVYDWGSDEVINGDVDLKL